MMRKGRGARRDEEFAKYSIVGVSGVGKGPPGPRRASVPYHVSYLHAFRLSLVLGCGPPCGHQSERRWGGLLALGPEGVNVSGSCEGATVISASSSSSEDKSGM
jgi:hypothetical protein